MLEDAEKIVVMEDGKITQTGSYNKINEISEVESERLVEEESNNESNSNESSSVTLDDIIIRK